MAINNAINASQTGVQCQTSGGVWNGRTITAGTGISVSNGDGVSGNPTITATGVSPGGLSTVIVYDDFLGTNAGGTNPGIGNANLSFNIVSNGVCGAQVGTATNPGIIGIATQNGTASSGAIFGGQAAATSGDYVLGGGVVTVQWVIKITTLSNGTDRFKVRCGLGNNLANSSNTPADGCWFEYIDNVNSGAWTINNVKSGSGTTSANTSNTADTSFHNLKVVVDAGATSVAYYYDGVEVSNSPLTTNIPTNGITFFVQLIKSAGTNNRPLWIDLLLFEIDLTTPRPG